MTGAPDLEQEDLGPDDETASSPPIRFAQQALLGALLIEPQLLPSLGGLESDHFDDDHTHRSLFAAIQALPPPDPTEHTQDPLWLSTVLDAALPTAPGLTLSLLHTLVQACPRPLHAPAYARMIRSDHARRTLLRHAEDLGRTAADTTLPDRAAAVITQTDSLGRFLDELTGQFPPHPGSLPRTPLPPDPPRHISETVLDEERLLLASATAYAEGLTRVQWLQPADFALPLHGDLFQCLTALTRRGDPVDPITVLWEAQHRSLLTKNLTAADLMALVSASAGSPEYWGERIVQRALLATAHTTAQRIRTFTEDPANTPHQLVTGSRRAIAELHAIRARYERTHTQPCAPTAVSRATRTPAAPRAGPPPRATAPPITARATR